MISATWQLWHRVPHRIAVRTCPNSSWGAGAGCQFRSGSWNPAAQAYPGRSSDFRVRLRLLLSYEHPSPGQPRDGEPLPLLEG